MTSGAKRQPIPFGKYLLLDRINIGGMAEVWRGKMFGAGGFERLVAIKRILPNIAEDADFITMFIDEAKITVQLTHANIAQVYDLGQIANSYYIAMEYVPGKDVRAIFDRCRKKGEPAPIPLTCYVVAKMCEGLDYAHRKKDSMGRDMNIVHRDISPQNALVSYEGEVKVIDFGIAKAAGKATKTQAGILKGKFAYMSPEQIRGLPLDRRSDVFAIGICLYELLTGERLFVGDSDFSVLEKVRKAEVLPPSTFNRRIPEALEKIVLRSLAKDVEDRYQYANELADDLQKFLITSDSIFSRKDLMQYMKSTFAEDVEREKNRLQEYGEVKPSEGMLAAMEMGVVGVPVAATPATPIQLTQPFPGQRPPGPASNSAVPGSSHGSTDPRNPGNSGSRPTLGNGMATPPRILAASQLLGNHAREGSGPTLVGPEALTQPGAAPLSTPMAHPSLTTDKILAPGPVAPTPGFGSFQSPGSGVTASIRPGLRPTTSHPTLQDPVRKDLSKDSSKDSTKDPSKDLSQDSSEGVATKLDAPRVDTAAMRPPTLVTREPDTEGPIHPRQGSVLAKVFGALMLILFAAGGGVAANHFLAKPTLGAVYVKLPEGAQKVRVSLGGVEVPQAKVETGEFLQQVPSGQVAVMIAAEGYITFTTVVDVKAGKDVTRVEPVMKLSEKTTELVVTPDPSEAEVLVDDVVVKKAGDRNPYTGTVAVGRTSKIEVKLAGYKSYVERVDATSAGQPYRVAAKLEVLPLRLKVETQPVAARVFVNGQDLGETPLELDVRGDVAEVTLKKACYEDRVVSLDAQARTLGSVSVSETLSSIPGCR